MKASDEAIAKSLQGTWRDEHLFALKQALAAFDFCGTQLAECDARSSSNCRSCRSTTANPPRARSADGAQRTEVRSAHAAVQGVRGGPDAHRRHRRDHRAGCDQRDRPRHVSLPHGQALHVLAWPVSGHQDHRRQDDQGKTKRVVNRATQALRLAAAALRSSKSALGAYFRRMCARMDKPKAVTAAAHKLARLIYTMLTKARSTSTKARTTSKNATANACFAHCHRAPRSSAWK